jgi:heme-degrading monooxygenase HmoA
MTLRSLFVFIHVVSAMGVFGTLASPRGQKATVFPEPARSTDPRDHKRTNDENLEATMKPVIVINRLAIKPGTIDEFIEAQLNYASSLMEKPMGLIGSRLYRGVDGRTVVLVSQFESIKSQEEIFQSPGFKAKLIYEEAYTNGCFDNNSNASPAFGKSPRRLQENRDADHAD